MEKLDFIIPMVVYVIFLVQDRKLSYKVGRKLGIDTDTSQKQWYRERWNKRRLQLRMLHITFLIFISIHTGWILFHSLSDPNTKWQMILPAGGLVLYLIVCYGMNAFGERDKLRGVNLFLKAEVPKKELNFKLPGFA